MSLRRMFVIAAFMLCTTVAFGELDQKYNTLWPANYFYHNSRAWLDTPKQIDMGVCGWQTYGQNGRRGNDINGVEAVKHIKPDSDDGESFSKRWLIHKVGSSNVYMLCAADNKDASIYIKNNQEDLHNYLQLNGNMKRYSAYCSQNKYVGATMPQSHLGDEDGYKYWKCECEDGECEWKFMQAPRLCQNLKGDGEVQALQKKNLLQDGYAVYLCGPSDDKSIKIGDSSLQFATYRGKVCDKGVQMAVFEPQGGHLGDADVGHAIWECQYDGKEWLWKHMGQVHTCTEDKIPPHGKWYDSTDEERQIQKRNARFAKGLEGSGTRDIFVGPYGNNRVYGQTTFGIQGYGFLADAVADDGTRLTDLLTSGHLCKTSICDGDGTDASWIPNPDYTTCVHRKKQCDMADKKYRVGQNINSLACLARKPLDKYIYKGPSQDMWEYMKNSEDHDKYLCDFVCTEQGWYIRVKTQPNPCRENYALSENGRVCLDMAGFSKYLCEQSGGSIITSGKKLGTCKCNVFKTDVKLENYAVNGAVYQYCASRDFLYNDATKSYESYIKNSYESYISVAANTSNATNFADTNSISNLVANLSQIEKQFGLSKWRTVDGKFNYARLASDATAGVVLGTTGALVTASVVKKKQVEDGFESLECTVGGQHVGDWGDVFRIDGK